LVLRVYSIKKRIIPLVGILSLVKQKKYPSIKT